MTKRELYFPKDMDEKLLNPELIDSDDKEIVRSAFKGVI